MVMAAEEDTEVTTEEVEAEAGSDRPAFREEVEAADGAMVPGTEAAIRW